MVAGTQEAYSLDIGTMTWTFEVSRIVRTENPFNMVKRRYGGGAAVAGQGLYFFGGAWNEGVSKFVCMLKPQHIAVLNSGVKTELIIMRNLN